jgi:KaiC/GvpD/RAD55 family RecA-like ATPase
MYDLGPAFDNKSVESGTNLLVAGPPLSGKRRMVLETLTYGASRGEGAVIVTTRDSSDRLLTDVRSLLAAPDDAPLRLVDCVTKHQGRSTNDSKRIKYTSSPVDMTGIGINFSEFIEELHTERDIERNRVVLDSLSTLLIYSDLQTVFRFMHVFTSRIADTEAIGIHLLDSTAHDMETINTLKQLFDGMITIEEDQSVSLQLPGSSTA